MQSLLKTLILGLVCAGIITGCGWQLRGSLALPPGADSIYVTAEDNYGTLTSDLRKLLEANNVQASDNKADAQYSIIILNQNEKRRTVAVGSSSLTAEYELTLDVEYRIEDADGKALVIQDTASTARSYSYDRNDTIAANEEEQLIKEEMRLNVVSQIMRRLRYSAAAASAGE